jgi:hypothetical protein
LPISQQDESADSPHKKVTRKKIYKKKATIGGEKEKKRKERGRE